MIEIPEKMISQLLKDRDLYGLRFSQMAEGLRNQGINISDNGLKERLRREGLVN